jgi:hypothetical protein
MTYHRFQSLRGGFARVAKVNFMVSALIRNIVRIAPVSYAACQNGYCGRFIVIRADVHDLSAQSFSKFHKTGEGQVELAFLFRQ